MWTKWIPIGGLTAEAAGSRLRRAAILSGMDSACSYDGR